MQWIAACELRSKGDTLREENVPDTSKNKTERSKTAGAPKRGKPPQSKGREASSSSRRQESRTTKSTKRGTFVSKRSASRSTKPKKPKQRAREQLYDQKVKEATKFMLPHLGNVIFDGVLGDLRDGDFEAPLRLLIDDLEEKVLRIFGRAYTPKLQMVLIDIVEEYGAQREEADQTIWSEVPASIRVRRDKPRFVRQQKQRLKRAA